MESGTMISDCEEEEQVDRLSNLPDDVIYKILSYVDIIYCIRLSVLSSRWRFIRSSLPILNFSCQLLKLLSTPSPYHDFVNDVLSARNNNIGVSSVSLDLSFLANPESSVLRILEYAFSHNVRQLSISSAVYNEFLPLSELSCKSLKHLTLIEISIDCQWDPSQAWDLPALTTLHLKHVELHHCCNSIIAMCQNLKSLTLEGCNVFEPQDSDGIITISNSQLVSLTLKKVRWTNVFFVYVDTPRLKNLIYVDISPGPRLKGFSVNLAVSAHDLTFLRIKGHYFPNLSLDGLFPSLEKVELCISCPQTTNVHTIFDLLQRLHVVKSLTLSSEIVELLSTSEQVISHQPSPFPSLKNLEIYPSSKYLTKMHSLHLNNFRLKTILDISETQPDEEQEAIKLKLSAQVTNYLLGSSSNATFTMISHEEARAIKITTAAYRLMADLQEILEQTEAKMTNSYPREDFFIHIVQPPADTAVIFDILHNIELLLTKVLASKRVEMQACYSRLCAKAKTVVNKMTVYMKNQWDIQDRIISGYLYDKIALSSLKN